MINVAYASCAILILNFAQNNDYISIKSKASHLVFDFQSDPGFIEKLNEAISFENKKTAPANFKLQFLNLIKSDIAIYNSLNESSKRDVEIAGKNILKVINNFTPDENTLNNIDFNEQIFLKYFSRNSYTLLQLYKIKSLILFLSDEYSINFSKFKKILELYTMSNLKDNPELYELKYYNLKFLISYKSPRITLDEIIKLETDIKACTFDDPYFDALTLDLKISYYNSIGDYEKSIMIFKNFNKIRQLYNNELAFPILLSVYSGSSNAYYMSNESDKAIACRARCVELSSMIYNRDGPFFKEHVIKLLRYYKIFNIEPSDKQSTNELKKIVLLDEEKSGYYLSEAKMNLQKKQINLAIGNLKKTLTYDSENIGALTLLAVLLKQNGEYLDSLKYCHKIFSLNYKSEQLYIIRSIIRGSRGEISLAIDDIDNAIIITKNRKSISNYLAQNAFYYLESGAIKISEFIAKKSLEVDPKNLDAKSLLAKIEAQKNNHLNALDLIDGYYLVPIENINYALNCADVLFITGRKNEATILIKKCLEKFPNEPELLYCASSILSKDNFNDGINYLLAIESAKIGIQNKNSQISLRYGYFCLGDAYYKAGNFQKSLDSFEKSLLILKSFDIANKDLEMEILNKINVIKKISK